MPSELIQKIASDSAIDTVYDWLCKRRKDYSHNDEVWDIRFRWSEFKAHLQKALLAGEYTISSQTVIITPGRRTELWSAKDALVLKAISLVIGEHLNPVLSRNCYHLAGNGGAKAAVRATSKHLKNGQHVIKSDVKSYYTSIDHEILFNLLQEYVPDRLVQKLLWQYIRRTVYCDEFYRDVKRGISLGCPLSPLMGALYLKQLDDSAGKTGLFYARFMDDWVVCRVGIAHHHELLSQTVVGNAHPTLNYPHSKAERGFDFLGYFLKPEMVNVSISTLKRFVKRMSQLYEQGADIVRIGEYVRNWLKWVRSGIRGLANMKAKELKKNDTCISLVIKNTGVNVIT